VNRLIPIDKPEDIPEHYRGTPVDRLLRWHNLGEELEPIERAELLIGMCMDNRKVLRTPEKFAFVIRSGGANLRHNEFKVSFAIAVGGVRAIAQVVHTQCGMVGLHGKREQFINGLVDVGWERENAVQHFDNMAPLFAIDNEIDFALSEAARLRLRYPRILVAPLLYKIEDNRLYCIRE
jgi:carbonic anhydrase